MIIQTKIINDGGKVQPFVKLSGSKISQGVAFAQKGHILYYEVPEVKDIQVPEKAADIETEMNRFHEACQLIEQRRNNCPISKETKALEDFTPAYIDVTEDSVRKELANSNKSLEYVVKKLTLSYLKDIEALLDFMPHMRDNYGDAEDVGRALLESLGVNLFEDFLQENIKPGNRYVLITNHIAPNMCYLMSNTQISGIATEETSATGHSAVVIKALEIPLLTGINVQALKEVDSIFIHADDGYIKYNIIDPKMIEQLKELARNYELDKPKMIKILTEPSEFMDGTLFNLHTTVNIPQEISSNRVKLADGVGLIRTEKLFIDENFSPSFGRQIEVYESIIKMHPEATFRIFDVAEDKPLPFIKGKGRGTNIIRQNESVFTDQIAAMVHSGAKNILFPMISKDRDARFVLTKLFSKASDLLNSIHRLPEKVDFLANVNPHLMLETWDGLNNLPEILDELSQYANKKTTEDANKKTMEIQKKDISISLGWNDFSYDVCGEDRYIHDKSIVKFSLIKMLLIEESIKMVHDSGFNISICGAVNPPKDWAYLLYGMGIDKISISSDELAEVKNSLQERNIKKYEAFKIIISQQEEVVEFLKFIDEYSSEKTNKMDQLIEFMGTFRNGVSDDKNNEYQRLLQGASDAIERAFLDQTSFLSSSTYY